MPYLIQRSRALVRSRLTRDEEQWLEFHMWADEWEYVTELACIAAYNLGLDIPENVAAFIDSDYEWLWERAPWPWPESNVSAMRLNRLAVR